MAKKQSSLFCTILFLLTVLKVAESKCGCRVHYKAIGCRKDSKSDRALPELLITERDKSSKKYNGKSIDWRNWNEYLPDFTCRCAEAAMKKGYRLFGLQYWGECWSGPSPAANVEYEKHGNGDLCYGPDYEKCTKGFDNCVGEEFTNFVYEIVPYDCPVKFQRLGCYGDDPSRTLSELLLTDRDRSSKAYSGGKIDWVNYDTYLPELACRCAQKLMEKGYKTFGLQYYGECWSGPDADEKYFSKGHSSNCLNRCYKPCANYNSFCIGEHFTNFVYRITTDVCEVKHKALGCFNENTEQRALKELIIDDVHPESPRFMGLVDTDFQNREEYLKDLVCRCARKIKEKGYKAFGIYNGGECWSGAEAHLDFEKYGSSNECYFNENELCGSDTVCVGGKNTAYVYQLDLDNGIMDV